MIRFFLKDKTVRMKETYTVDWSGYIPSGAVITGGAPSLATAEGTVVAADGVNNSGAAKSTFSIAGGIKDEVAKVIVGVDLDNGDKLDAECILGVR